MRCKKHLSDLTSGIGVCASCLRERLLALIAAQLRQAQAQGETEDHRKSDTHPLPLILPRSVSPYICRRFDDSSWQHHHHNHQNDRRFYSTPQVGSTARKKKTSKFSLFSSLFTSSASRSGEIETDARVSRDSLATSNSGPISSSSWFSSLISGHRRKQSRLFSVEDATVASHRPSRTRVRGMSPAKGANEDEDYIDEEGSPKAGGFSPAPESSPGWRKQVSAPPVRRKGPPQHSRNVSGLAFCLSPLVRASPNSHRNQKGAPPGMVGSGEIGFSGETRVSKKPHLSTAASFCANRSRKLADFGRFNYNP